MPFTPAQQNKCKRCDGSVYQAEEKKDSDGGYWHNKCFTCKNCPNNNKTTRLDSTNLCMNEGKAGKTERAGSGIPNGVGNREK